MSAMHGSTENATSAKRQSIHSSTSMMPTRVNTSRKTEITPDANRSFSASTSVGHAGHQSADGIAVVEAEIEPLQMVVDLHAQIEHDPLPHHLHRVGLHVLQRERADQHDEKRERDPVEAVQVAGDDVVVDRDLRQIRLGELQPGVADDGGERHDHRPAMRTQIGQQPPHQARVIRLTKDLVGFV